MSELAVPRKGGSAIAEDPAISYCHPDRPMNDIPMDALHRRVLTTNERVKFAAADPYAHMASGAYVDMIMSHRVEALDDLVGFSIMGSASSGIAFPARRIDVLYLRPAFVGDLLEVGSWIEELRNSSFEVRAVVIGAKDRRVRALARIDFVTVDAKTGKALPIPASLPAAGDPESLSALPALTAYLDSIRGLPADWISLP
jgi:YbgC/YbaW family acyl-CoA thioester hydrolase